MKASESKLLKLLDGRKQFIIPIYQRTYNWTLKQCEQLWSDILRVADEKSHFIGSIVYIEKGVYHTTSIPQLLVVDGQQRLTTLFLLLSALGNALDKHDDSAEITKRKIDNYYLLNNEEESDLRYKLVLTKSDRETLNALIDNRELPEEPSSHIVENYQYFVKMIANTTNLNKIFNGINKLVIIDVALERDHDDPQLIFESFNSKGLDLSQTDLIRNFVLMKLDHKEQTEVYNHYWYPMEREFANSPQPALFDAFIRDYLSLFTGKIPIISDIYLSFKTYVQKSKAFDSIRGQVEDLYRYAKYFAKFALLKETQKDLRNLFQRINELKVDVAYPFMLMLYKDYDDGRLSCDDFIEILKLLESYILRRIVCNLASNSLNKIFVNLCMELDKTDYLASFQLALISKDAYKRFPKNEEFTENFIHKDIYNSRYCKYILENLENYGRKETISAENYTIEHILPQNENLSPEWLQDLSDTWEETHAKYLHTIGNLTLTGYNPELSDRPFLAKRDLEGGFADSPLRLNRLLAQLDKWNRDHIIERAKEWANEALKIWTYPEIDFSDSLQTATVREMIASVFATEKDFLAAKELFKQIIRVADYETAKHILSFTYRTNKISVNYGQWLILRFKAKENFIEAAFCIDFGIYNKTDELDIYKLELFDKRWAKEKDIRLVYFPWDSATVLPEDFITAWHSAITHAFSAFRKWVSSGSMRIHNETLAKTVLDLEESIV